jgi:alpha,alpha-trehalase
MIERKFLYPGGVVATTVNTGQQWDAPNGWPPLQWITIQGLRNYGFADLSNEIKKNWVDLNVQVYKRTGKMLEKYNVQDMTLLSGGGEYPVQDGFGWTNGVLLRLLSE